MTRGRPTTCTPAIKARAEEYLTGYAGEGDAFPSAAGLAVFLGISRERLYGWARSNPDFKDTMERIQTQQERVLLNGGARGELNSNIVKLVLGKHGYSERKETDLKSSDGSMAQPTTIELIAVPVDRNRPVNPSGFSGVCA